MVSLVALRAEAGGDDAPELTETLTNLAINGAAVAVLGWVVRRDLTTSDRDKKVVVREESLARLQVSSCPLPSLMRTQSKRARFVMSTRITIVVRFLRLEHMFSS